MALGSVYIERDELTALERRAATAEALIDVVVQERDEAKQKLDAALRVISGGYISGDKRVAPVMLEKEMGCSFIWVVWAVKPGAARLLAVCSDERHADHYCANMPPGLSEFKPWKERAPLDHGFGFADSMHARVQGKL